MRTEMAVESLLELVERSGVISGDDLQHVLKEFRERRPQFDSPRKITDELVARGTLTRWQAEQLLHGKHRGFYLGPYRILDLLGSGGMGRVFLAEHQRMRRRCAIKVLPPKKSEREASAVDRFYREAQAVAALDHPNIVRAYDVNMTHIDETEVHYLVMEYVDGQDLQRMVEKQGPLRYRQAADFIRQAAEGLAHAHRRGFVHRDVKPANLIVDAQGVVKILDLGLAWCFDTSLDAAAALGEGVAGTADYLAPEQAVNSQSVDARADIYSLGQTFYFLLTGHPPFPVGTIPERLLAHQTKSPEPITNSRPDAPARLLAIIDHMTAKRPEVRYPSAQHVVDALELWLRDRAAGTGSGVEDADLELAPLEEEPSRAPEPLATNNRGGSAPPKDVKRESVGTGRTGPRADDLPPLAPLAGDLVAALNGNDLMSKLLAGEPAAPPAEAQRPLAGPRLRRPPQDPLLTRLLGMPAFWIGVAGAAVIVLIVGIVLSRSPSEQSPQTPSEERAQGTKEPERPKQPDVPPDVPPPPPPDKGGQTVAPPQPPEKVVSPVEPAPPPGAEGPAKDPGVVIPVGATWKFLHPTDGVDPAAKDPEFHSKFPRLDYDDSSWKTGEDSGGAEGGFGYGDPAGVVWETPAREHRKTSYLRHRFKTTVRMDQLVLSLQRDDGIIVYLDGKEVLRDNVRDGADAYDLPADRAIADADETRLNTFTLPGSLEPGEHVLAISLHNRPDGSSDLRIAEISLRGTPAVAPPR